jgi:hypothetical protein
MTNLTTQVFYLCLSSTRHSVGTASFSLGAPRATHGKAQRPVCVDVARVMAGASFHFHVQPAEVTLGDGFRWVPATQRGLDVTLPGSRRVLEARGVEAVALAHKTPAFHFSVSTGHAVPTVCVMIRAVIRCRIQKTGQVIVPAALTEIPFTQLHNVRQQTEVDRCDNTATTSETHNRQTSAYVMSELGRSSLAYGAFNALQAVRCVVARGVGHFTSSAGHEDNSVAPRLMLSCARSRFLPCVARVGNRAALTLAGGTAPCVASTPATLQLTRYLVIQGRSTRLPPATFGRVAKRTGQPICSRLSNTNRTHQMLLQTPQWGTAQYCPQITMTSKSYSCLGLKANVSVPDSVTEFDNLAKKEGACLAEAIANVVYRSVLAGVRSDVVEVLEKETGIPRNMKDSGKTKDVEVEIDDPENPGQKKKTSQKVAIYVPDESEQKYVDRVQAQLKLKDEEFVARFQPLMDKVVASADNKFDPSVTEGQKKERKLPDSYKSTAERVFTNGTVSKNIDKIRSESGHTVTLVEEPTDTASPEWKVAREANIMALGWGIKANVEWKQKQEQQQYE